MRITPVLGILAIASAIAFAIDSSAPAAPSSGPQPVVVTNSTVPVSGSVTLTGPITSTITGTPNVTVTNTTPISVATPRFPRFFRTFANFPNSNAPFSTNISYPSGYTRLVVDTVSYSFFCAANTVAKGVWVSSIPSNSETYVPHFLPMLAPSGTPGAAGLEFSNTVSTRLIVDADDNGVPDALWMEAHTDLSPAVDGCGNTSITLDGHFEP